MCTCGADWYCSLNRSQYCWGFRPHLSDTWQQLTNKLPAKPKITVTCQNTSPVPTTMPVSRYALQLILKLQLLINHNFKFQILCLGGRGLNIGLLSLLANRFRQTKITPQQQFIMWFSGKSVFYLQSISSVGSQFYICN